MQTAGVTILLATAALGFAQQDVAPGTQKIPTCTGLELQVMLPAARAPFRVYFAYNSTEAREYSPPASNVVLFNQGAPEFWPPVIVSPAVVCDPQILFDTAARDELSGRLERAKLTLLQLASTYSESPLVAKAKVEIGAIYLLEEAQARVRSGQSRAAYDTFNVLVVVYPESVLAGVASAEMRNLDPGGKWKR